MQRLEMPLDLTHLSDTSFREAVDAFAGPIYASHSNCRTLSPHQRQLTDEMIRVIVERGGVVGVVPCNPMVRADLIHGDAWNSPQHGVTLEHLADHVDHVCQLAGSAEYVAIGSDADGGFGAEACPHGHDRHRDLHALLQVLADRGYATSDQGRIAWRNWSDFYLRTLPHDPV